MILIISLWKDADIMKWYKNNHDNKIWWLDDPMTIGKLVFSFDKKLKKQRFASIDAEIGASKKKLHN